MSCEDIPSLLDLQNTKKHADDFGRLIGTGEGTSTNGVTGQVRPTYNKVINDMNSKFDGMIVDMNSEFDQQIQNLGYTRVGTFASGGTLRNGRQTLLWDIADGGDGQEYGWSGSFLPSGKVVPPGSTPTSTGGIAVGAWMSRFDPELRVQVRETQRRICAEAGDNLVDGSFEVGGELVNANDVLLQERTGKAFSGPAGTVAAGTDPTLPGSGYVPRTDATLRSDLASKSGSGLLGFSHDIAYAPNTAGFRLKNTIYVTDAPYNADPTGVLDSTAGIQAAINDAFTLKGGRLFSPNGVYKLTNALVIPFSAGWSMIGGSRSGCVYKQYTNNTPILSFLTPLTHGFTIEGIQFDYAVQQGSSNTSANHIYFDAPNGYGSSGFFNFNIKNCAFSNGYYSIASNNAANGVSIWGANIAECEFFGSNTGGAIRLLPSPACGQPNISLRNIYINCENHTGSALRINYGDNLLCETVELNSGGNYGAGKVQVDFSTCSHVTMLSCKSEQASITASGALWQFPNSNAILAGCHINGISVGAGVSNSRLIEAISGGKLSVKGFAVTADVVGSGSAVGLFNATTLGSIEGVVVPTSPSGIYKQLVGSNPPHLDVDLLQANASTTRVDVSVTLTASDSKFQYFNTALTAKRQVTLPSSGVYAGMEFTIIRWGLGAFILQVIDPLSGKSINIPESTKASVTYRADSSGEWVPIQYSVFP